MKRMQIIRALLLLAAVLVCSVQMTLSQPSNPLTGKRTSAWSNNPYTNKAKPGGANYNPLTGKSAQQNDALTWPTDKVPITGKGAPGLERLDKVVLSIMDRHSIPGAALAIAKNGKLIYAKGFGWHDLRTASPTSPQTLFGLASVSKPLTAMGTLLLVEQGKLKLDDKVFTILNHIKPPRGARIIDARLKTITVRQCLNHTGGWDRAIAGDPINQLPQIARLLGVRSPLTVDQLLSYIIATKLNFTPGTKMVYSNVGYMILGRVIERITGQSYEQFVFDKVMKPSGIKNAFVSKHKRHYKTNESHRYLAGATTELPPLDEGAIQAAAGWTASVVDLARFLTALDGSRGTPLLKETTIQEMLALPPPPLKKNADGTHHALGWPAAIVKGKLYGYTHDGSLWGMRTFIKRMPTGVNSVLFFNVSVNADAVDIEMLKKATKEIHDNIEEVKKHADVDYFKDYP